MSNSGQPAIRMTASSFLVSTGAGSGVEDLNIWDGVDYSQGGITLINSQTGLLVPSAGIYYINAAVTTSATSGSGSFLLWIHSDAVPTRTFGLTSEQCELNGNALVTSCVLQLGVNAVYVWFQNLSGGSVDVGTVPIASISDIPTASFSVIKLF
jgi:hypothetical protein